jgi:hypothetical protein
MEIENFAGPENPSTARNKSTGRRARRAVVIVRDRRAARTRGAIAMANSGSTELRCPQP